MCVTFCHKRHILFFTHEDCPPLQCRFTHPDQWGSCHDCTHNQAGRCALTNAPTPVDGGGCCHWGVELAAGPQTIDIKQITLLPSFVKDQPVADVLDSYGVDYELVDSRVIVDPDEMPLPLVYGRGTDPAEDDMFDFGSCGTAVNEDEDALDMAVIW